MSPKLEQLADALAPLIAERLAPQIADELVDHLVELRDLNGSSSELIDAAEVARRYGVSRDWAYNYAAELGAVRLGDGPKPRIRFDPATVAEALSARPDPRTEPTPARRRRRPSGAELLPIKGRRP